MSQIQSTCTFCGSTLKPGMRECDFCGAPVEGARPEPAAPSSPPPPAVVETPFEAPPTIAAVEPPPASPPPFPMSNPEVIAFPAAEQTASPASSRRVWLWVLVALLAVLLICVCGGVIWGLSLL